MKLHDEFTLLDLEKPRLFLSSNEVMAKTGIFKNLLWVALICAVAACMLALPLNQTVVDRRATVMAIHEVHVASPMDGFVDQVFVEKGQTVKRGDRLLKVSSKWHEMTFNEIKSEIKILEKELSAEKIQKEIAILKSDQAKNLVAMGSMDETALKEIDLNVGMHQSRIETLGLKLIQAQDKLHSLEQIIQQGELSAVFDGQIISSAGLKQKSFVKQGEFLLALAGNQFLLEAKIKERDYSRITAGGTAEIKFHAFPGKIMTGKIVSIQSEPASPAGGLASNFNVQQKENYLKVLIQFHPNGISVQNGMKAKVLMKAPAQSLLRRFYHEIF